MNRRLTPSSFSSAWALRISRAKRVRLVQTVPTNNLVALVLAAMGSTFLS